MNLKSAQGSSYGDRTPEFSSMVEKLRKSQSSSNGSSRSKASSIGERLRKSRPSRSKVALQTDFNKRASKIGYRIHQTSQKLAKLAKLAKRISIFDDTTMEIQKLTAVIKQDITALNAAIVDLQLVCNAQNENERISTDTTTHSTTVVENLENRLMEATKEFKKVLSMRIENLKVCENRRRLFSADTLKDYANPFARQRPIANKSTSTGLTSPPPWVNNNLSNSSPLFPRKEADEVSQPLLQPQQSQSQQQRQMVPLQDSCMQSRTDALHNVESTIHDLGTIFPQFATMVSQQGKLAIRIDENMEDTLANVEGVQGQLMRIQPSQCKQQQHMVPLLDSCMQSQAEALHKVESTIHELGTIITQLATIVSQQRELAIRIDENMEDTLANVEGAQWQLMRYLNSISSNMWLVITIFFVLIVFLIIFLFFVA